MADSKPDVAVAKDAPAPTKGPSPVVTMALVAIVAGGASFGGVRLGAAHHGGGEAGAHAASSAMKPPGPTVALDPFIASIPDAQGRAHAMKLTIAIELESNAKDEAVKPFIPRVRDATLGYLRSTTYEVLLDSNKVEKARADLLERYKAVGLPGAERILITDLVLQ